MNICNGCSGIIGKDCFNPQECEEIAMRELMAEVAHQEAVKHIKECDRCRDELLKLTK